MRRVLMNLTAAVLLGATATAAQAVTPTETVKMRVEQALQSVGQTPATTPEGVERRRTEIRRAADSLFDFTEMSRRALGRQAVDDLQALRRLERELQQQGYLTSDGVSSSCPARSA